MRQHASPRPVLLIVQHLTQGGSERQVCEMALALDRTRFQPHVGYFRPGGIRADELRAANVPLAEFPLRSFLSPGNVTATVRSLRRYVRAQGIEVVHGFDPPSCLLVGVAAPWLRDIVTLTSQRNHQQVRTRPVRIGVALAHRIVDGIVVNCEAMREHLVTDERIRRDRIHLCYNGLDIARFTRVASGQAALIPKDALVVGTLCALRPEKDLSLLVKAFASCASADPRLFLLVVGSGPELGRLQEEARQLGVFDRCRFEPSVADVVPWLSLMDIFVLSSRFEALPNALMEAMAVGCACVATRVGGTPELIEVGESGLLFERGDAATLTSHIQRLAGDAPLRQRMGAAASRRMREGFSLGASATRLGQIYDERLAEKARR